MSLWPLAVLAVSALPDGWREAQPLKNTICRSPNAHQADLDGDGIEDTVRLLSRKDGLKLGLFVWLADGKPTLIETFDVLDGAHQLSIDLQPPTRVQTWCGRYGWCEPGNPAWLTLKQPTIALVSCESSMRYLVWNPKTKNFSWVLMSD